MGRVLPFVIAALLSVVVLFTPESGVPSSPPGTDKVVHTLLFALLAFTGLYAKISRVLLLLVAYAGVSEVLQQLITPLHRSGDVIDALVDVLGIGLGWLVFTKVVNARRDRRRLRADGSDAGS
ncbi:VanZ family protein [Lentzea sp. NPDC051838]|uniref:VanZ family protein n=1 Tax=Lentzea sp. NPDC051838 TaxID=3154849 RepID=UPI003441A2C1